MRSQPNLRRFLMLVLVFCGAACSGTEPGILSNLAGPGSALAENTPDILEQLQAIDGMSVAELPDPPPDYRAFLLNYEQPVDHQEEGGAVFAQRMLLYHRSVTAPMVLNTRGYSLGGGFREPTVLLAANQLAVEHRFFGTSIPEVVTWDKLTIEQAAADHHRIVTAVRPLYEGAWISTGASKGGMTAMYHRRFYPDDVDATIPYVAPNSFGHRDPRYVWFLSRVGDAACRSALMDLQRETLLRRDAIRGLAAAWSEQFGLTYGLEGGLDHAIDIMVGEFLFGFWQYDDPALCAEVPTSEASDAEIFEFVNSGFLLFYASDAGIRFFAPYYYQAATQLGYPLLPTRHIDDLLLYDPNDYDVYTPVPAPVEAFDWPAMIDVALWTALKGESLLFVYGEYDPWTAGAYFVFPHNHRDAHQFVVAAGNHSAKISLLDPDDQAAALAILEGWTGVSPIVTPPTEFAARRAPQEFAIDSLFEPEAGLLPPFRFRLRR